MRIGIGFDAHSFELNSPLILGGVNIPFNKGLRGHSDADVLIHAIMDAMLGSYALKDIGYHFPDNDNQFKDISSIELLNRVKGMINNDIINIDATILCQLPKLALYIDSMRKNIASTLDISVDRVSIKATTTEYMGFIGREEGIAAIAVVLVGK